MDHNPYSALRRLCSKYHCSPCDIQGVLGTIAVELEQVKEDLGFVRGVLEEMDKENDGKEEN